MPYNDTALNRMVAAEAAAATWYSANTTGDVPHGSRQQTTWGAVAAGDTTGTKMSFPVAAGVDIVSVTLWTAATGGTNEGTWPIATESFPNGGTFEYTPTLDVDAG